MASGNKHKPEIITFNNYSKACEDVVDEHFVFQAIINVAGINNYTNLKHDDEISLRKLL